jgi:hypothetical protein
MTPECKRDVYRLSNEALTTGINSMFTLSGMDDITKRIFAEVKQRGWSGAAFARRINDAYDRQHFQHWKKRGFPKAEYPRVAEIFGWSMDVLFGNEAPQRPAGAAEQPASYEVLVGANQGLFLAEFRKLPQLLQMQVSQLVHGMVGELVRDGRRKPAAPASSSRRGQQPNA